SGDSAVACRIAAVWPKALRLDTSISDYLAPHMILLEAVASRGGEFDVIHSHVDYVGYPLLRRAGVPFLTTLHGRLDLPVLQHIYRTFDDVPVVTISDAQREPVPNANYLGTIQHGIPERLLLPGFGAGGYLAFLGRISPEKAPDAAIRIAQKAGMPIRIAAKVDQVDRDYFEELVKPMLTLRAEQWFVQRLEIAPVNLIDLGGNADRHPRLLCNADRGIWCLLGRDPA